MNTFANRLSFYILGLLTLYMCALSAHAASPTYEQIITKPFYDGYPLSYCFYSGKKCGKFTADKYCQDRGFMSAKTFAQSKESTVTKYMSTAALCQGKSCYGFNSIQCVGEKKLSHPIYIPSENRNTVLFNQPNYLGERVNSCEGFDVDCAYRTADRYCQMHGYQKSTAIQRWSHAGPTRFLESKKSCQGRDHCHAYRWIRCERYPTG